MTHLGGGHEGATRLRRTDLDAICTGAGDSLRGAIKAIQEGGIQICLVVNEDRALLGTITDGDIRRGILRGVSLEAPVSEVMHREFHRVQVGTTLSDNLRMMRRHFIHHLPLVDEHGRLVELLVLDDLLHEDSLEIPALIMAGGEGRRLRPLTSNVPKPLLSVGDKAILEIVIDLCAAAGIDTIYISVNYLADQIKQRIGDGSRWGVTVVYLEEPRPLGTAGALGMIDKRLERPLLVINGDVLTRVDFRQLLDFHEASGAAITICTRVHETKIAFGVVEFHGLDFVDIVEKPTLRHMVSAGVYVIAPEVVSSVEPGVPIDMPDVVRESRQIGPVKVFPIHEYWSDVGSHDALREAEIHWT